MKYATWQLNFDNPKYGTGPEAQVVKNKGTCEAAYAEGDITKGARILGYFTGEPTEVESWKFIEITQLEALNFVLALDETAYIAENGRIKIIYQEETI